MCLSLTDCLSCSQKPGVRYLNKTSCITECPLYTHIQNETSHVCVPCQQPCKECQGTATTCTTCQDKYLLKNSNSCVSTCGSRYYADQSFCHECSSGCLDCSVAATNCTSCPPA